MEAKAKATDTQISKAFKDLDQLMEMAKPMVSLAKSISGKIRVSIFSILSSKSQAGRDRLDRQVEEEVSLNQV